jgi:hypothetical protein
LTEAAWNYRFKARIGKEAQLRQQDLSEPIRMMAWNAQLRLTQRFAGLNERGLQANKVCVAVARELAGFVWAVGMQAQRENLSATCRKGCLDRSGDATRAPIGQPSALLQGHRKADPRL